jgi:hypothetical protein
MQSFQVETRRNKSWAKPNTSLKTKKQPKTPSSKNKKAPLSEYQRIDNNNQERQHPPHLCSGQNGRQTEKDINTLLSSVLKHIKKRMKHQAKCCLLRQHQ